MIILLITMNKYYKFKDNITSDELYFNITQDEAQLLNIKTDYKNPKSLIIFMQNIIKQLKIWNVMYISQIIYKYDVNNLSKTSFEIDNQYEDNTIKIKCVIDNFIENYVIIMFDISN